MGKSKRVRPWPEGDVPLVNVEGKAFEAGQMLGYIWGETLRGVARGWTNEALPWWMDKRFEKLISRYAPHLPDLFRGLAKGAFVSEKKIDSPAPPECAGCTSFAIHPDATLDGAAISGQMKDTPSSRQFQYQVLRLKLTDAPSALTLTYPGQVFGHGFVQGRCSVFRNSLYTGEYKGSLPFFGWGLLAVHCPSVDDAIEMTREFGVQLAGHCSVADERGGMVGMEFTKGGIGFVRPKNGLYTHANAIVTARLRRHETCKRAARRDSLHRESRLRQRLEADHGRLTAQLAWMALCDHDGYPNSLCRHESLDALSTAAVVAAPARGLLHVSRGSPCQNWPRTYSL